MRSEKSGFRLDRFTTLAEAVTSGFKRLLDELDDGLQRAAAGRDRCKVP